MHRVEPAIEEACAFAETDTPTLLIPRTLAKNVLIPLAPVRGTVTVTVRFAVSTCTFAAVMVAGCPRIVLAPATLMAARWCVPCRGHPNQRTVPLCPAIQPAKGPPPPGSCLVGNACCYFSWLPLTSFDLSNLSWSRNGLGICGADGF